MAVVGAWEGGGIMMIMMTGGPEEDIKAERGVDIKMRMTLGGWIGEKMTIGEEEEWI